MFATFTPAQEIAGSIAAALFTALLFVGSATTVLPIA